MKQGMRRGLWMTMAGVGMAGAFYAGVAYAADQRLADADSNCEKAIALLQAAENPGVKPPFGGHRDAAIGHLKKARAQIAKAQKYADSHQPKAPKKPE